MSICWRMSSKKMWPLTDRLPGPGPSEAPHPHPCLWNTSSAYLSCSRVWSLWDDDVGLKRAAWCMCLSPFRASLYTFKILRLSSVISLSCCCSRQAWYVSSLCHCYNCHLPTWGSLSLFNLPVPSAYWGRLHMMPGKLPRGLWTYSIPLYHIPTFDIYYLPDYSDNGIILHH